MARESSTLPATAGMELLEGKGHNLDMKILVLGGGAQGRVIASDVARSLPQATVKVVDLRQPQLPTLANLSWLEADLATPESLVRLLADVDLAVGALPSRLGFATMKAAVECKTPLVDVSFSAEDPLALDAEARAAGITIVPDCGLAPGLSHLIVGRAVHRRGMPEEITILVGGVAADRSRPYGYVVTWSVDDLLEEYTRPARIMKGGKITSVPVFSGMETITVPDVGELEAFYSDGLRSLLHTLPDVPEMGEKTLRWPGHVASIQPLLRSGRLVEEFRKHCVVEEPRDVVALVVRARWNGVLEEWTMVDRHDPSTGLTAMSRSTAFTTSVVTQLAARGGLRTPGVRPLELVATDADACRFIVDEMAARGVQIRTS